MATPATRPGSFGDLLSWLENGLGVSTRDLGATPIVRVEDYVEDDTYVLRAEMPGIDPDKDVELTLSDGSLTIRGERREEKKEKNRQEFQYGSFSRRIPLPADVDATDISATYTDGVLEVRVPVKTSAPDAQKIPVTRSDTA